jgi:hypothetical protein
MLLSGIALLNRSNATRFGLMAVIAHEGTLSQGHYTCYIRGADDVSSPTQSGCLGEKASNPLTLVSPPATVLCCRRREGPPRLDWGGPRRQGVLGRVFSHLNPVPSNPALSFLLRSPPFGHCSTLSILTFVFRATRQCLHLLSSPHRRMLRSDSFRTLFCSLCASLSIPCPSHLTTHPHAQ